MHVQYLSEADQHMKFPDVAGPVSICFISTVYCSWINMYSAYITPAWYSICKTFGLAGPVCQYLHILDQYAQYP
jgi:hypothetical protein